MKPVKSEDELTELLDNKSLLLLDRNALGVHYVEQLVACKTTNIKTNTKGARTLPIELWDKILGYASADTPKSFCFVQLISLGTQSGATVLECRAIKWPQGTDQFSAGDIESGSKVFDFEKFMKHPNKENSDQVNLPPIELADGDTNTFHVFLTSADAQLHITSASLFSDITVPDVISRMEDGECSFCGGCRNICPGCTGGRAEEFDVSMGCGVYLACPLCLGRDVSLEHYGFLRQYENDGKYPEDEERAMDEWIGECAAGLGYKWPWPESKD